MYSNVIKGVTSDHLYILYWLKANHRFYLYFGEKIAQGNKHQQVGIIGDNLSVFLPQNSLVNFSVREQVQQS